MILKILLLFAITYVLLHSCVFCDEETTDELVESKIPEELLQPQDDVKQPEEILEESEVTKDPEEVVPESDDAKQPDDMLKAPEDMLKAPEDMLKAPEDMLKAPDDMLKAPDDMLKVPESILTPQEGANEEKVHGAAAFDIIYKHNEDVNLEHNHPPGFHVFEGDIVVPDIEMDQPVDAQKRGAVKSELRLWRERTIPYVIQSKNQSRIKSILSGMTEISSKSCIKFVPKTIEKNYLRFIKGHGCWSFIGVRGGAQDISIGEGCEYRAIVAHEILHALGFYHEQSRLDRDDYIHIYWNNIDKKNAYNFNKAPPNAYTDSNLPYDLKSVMHYGNFAFTKNGKYTIDSIKFPQLALGNMIGLSPGDVDELAALYRCNELPNGGFGPWYDESSCIDGLRIRFRVCYGNVESVCGGFGVSNGVQRVREVCEGSEPLAAYMEGCYNQIHPEIVDLPLQAKATGVACASLNSPSKDYFEWRKKQKVTYIICAHFARNDGYMVFGISNYCHCHYGDDLIDMKANGKSKWCTKGYGVKDSIFMYRFEKDSSAETGERKNAIRNNTRIVKHKKLNLIKRLRRKHHF